MGGFPDGDNRRGGRPWVRLSFDPLKAQRGLTRQLAGGERLSGGDVEKVCL